MFSLPLHFAPSQASSSQKSNVDSYLQYCEVDSLKPSKSESSLLNNFTKCIWINYVDPSIALVSKLVQICLLNLDFLLFYENVHKSSYNSMTVLLDSQTCEKQRWVKDGPFTGV